MNFNILDVLPDDINNIDLTRSYVYVLELNNKHYYVGRTSNFLQRMNEHFTGVGAKYTKKYKPTKIIEVNEEINVYDERDKTLEYMNLYGYENVRGYAWCRETLLKKPKIKKKEKNVIERGYEDEGIRNLYANENKDIIEIGSILNKSPGSISFSLEKMKIVERRQLSRGYFDYVFSDLYDKYKRKKEPKEEKRVNSELTKEALINIKQRVKEMIKLNLGNTFG